MPFTEGMEMWDKWPGYSSSLRNFLLDRALQGKSYQLRPQSPRVRIVERHIYASEV